MIAGETIAWLEHHGHYPGEYDQFRRRRDPFQEPGKGRQILDKIGGVVNSLGGFEAIGRTVDNLSGRPTGFQPGLNQMQQFPQPLPPPRPRVPVAVWIIGGVVLLAGGTILVLSLRKKTPA